MEARRLGDRHHGDGISRGLHLELEGRIGLHTGIESGELSFRHAEFGMDSTKA